MFVAVVAACVVGVLAGCGVPLSEEGRVAVQTTQLAEYVAQADKWGEDIIAQLPREEIRQDLGVDGGSQPAGALHEERPRYYLWSRSTTFHEGGRTPTEVADDPAPWLEAQGWATFDPRYPPGRETLRRDYFRDGYHLMVEVYTVPPPHPQKIDFSIVTTRVFMSPDALPCIFRTWSSSGSSPRASAISTWDRTLTVVLDTDRARHCVARFSPDAPTKQVAGTAILLPALCDEVPAADVSLFDGDDYRSINLRLPDYAIDRKVDLEVLRALPGAESAEDQEWNVDGDYY